MRVVDGEGRPEGRWNGWTRVALWLWILSFVVLAILVAAPARLRPLALGLALVAAPLATGAACLAAYAKAPKGARLSWIALAVGAALSTAGQVLSVRSWISVQELVAFPSASFFLFVGFHLCVAQAAVVALRPAREPRLALEIALDGVLVLLVTALALLRFALDAPVTQGWLSEEDAAAILVGQIVVAGSLLFTALLVLWRDSEISGGAADALFIAVVFFTFGNVLVTMGLEPLPERIGDPFDAIRFGGWIAMSVAALIAVRNPAPAIATDRRATIARRTRLVVIPAVALLLAVWAVDVGARGGATQLGYVTTLALGLTLATRIGVALHAVEREAEERRSAERHAALARLRAVTAQMNPHFLFNALHSLSALMRRDVQASEDVVERLGALLRYGLDRGDAPVTFAQEWSFAKNYLRLEKIRLRDRLAVETDIDPAVLDFLVPPFVLQPLIENAIRHGVDRHAAGGRLRVEARVEDAALHVEVWDSGPGADEAAITDGDGVGLRGVRAQLATHCGPAAALSAARPPGGGFSIYLTLPIMQED